MPKIHVLKSTTINAPADKVFAAINDFHHWPAWSPWLIAEPEAKVDVAADGKSYSWDGNRVGAGSMEVLRETPSTSLSCDLTFLKPWKSTAKVNFRLQEQGGQTKVDWTMDSSLPFFLFWMKNTTVAYIGSDYERGLRMLKEYVENGHVSSKLDFKGVESFAGYKYIGIKRDTTLEKLGSDMEGDFGRLGQFIADNPSVVTDRMFSIYHKWDVAKGKASYTSGFPVKEVPANLPAGFTSGEIPATSVYTLRHVGPYEHLGNAWSTMYMMHRNKEFKFSKGIHPFETYVNNPQEVAPEELITDIHFAVAS